VSYGVDALRNVALMFSVPPGVLSRLTMQSAAVDVLILIAFGTAFIVPAVLLFAKQD
jgi:hypothetical protein